MEWITESPVTTTIVTLIVTILLAFAGYIFTYFNNLRLQRRKDKLERVNRQLKEFYGPLYALTHTYQTGLYGFLIKRVTRKDFFEEMLSTPDSPESAKWRLWTSGIVMPLYLTMEKVILENTDLLDDEEIPDCIAKLMAHIGGYKIIVKQWEMNDFSEHLSIIGFPLDLLPYLEKAYNEHKTKQAKLLGMHKRRWWRKLRSEKSKSVTVDLGLRGS